MATKVVIPNMGDKEREGVIGMWFKGEGEAIKQGEILCTVETEKASVEIEAPCSGILKMIVCPRDAKVSVGDCIAIIGNAEEDINELKEVEMGLTN